MAVKSFEMDQDILKTLETLKSRFNVSTDAAVIQRALGLADVATLIGGADKVVTLDGSGGKRRIALDQ